MVTVIWMKRLPPMPPLFKYCRREHMESMLDHGSVKLGSLSEYRAHEGQMVGDPREGTKVIAGYISEIRPETAHLFPRLREAGLHFHGLSERIQVENCTMTAPDQLVLSMASMYSRDAHQRWRDSEGYDACYRIDDPSSFLEAITAVIVGEFKRGQVGLVTYADIEDITVREPGDDPAFVKRTGDFADQAEFRATWYPRQAGEVASKIIAASDARRYVSVMAVL